MSFFQGMAQAFKDGDDQRFRMKVLGEEQDFTLGRDASQREHEKAMRMADINARRTEALLQATAGRSTSGANTAVKTNPADLQWFGSRVQGVEGAEEFIGQFNLSPDQMGPVKEYIEEVEAERAKKGLPPLTGQQIVEAFKVYRFDMPQEDAFDISSIKDMDLTDDSQYAEAVRGVTQDRAPRSTFGVDQTGLVMPDFALQEKAVNGMIVTTLTRQIAALAGDESPAATRRQAELAGLINGIEDKNPQAIMRAYTEYGKDAVDLLVGAGVFGMDQVMKNPLLSPLFIEPQTAPTAPVTPDLVGTPATAQPASGTPVTASPEVPAPTPVPPAETGERTLIQQDFNTMEEAQSFLQTLPPGRYLIMVDGEEVPARVE